MGYTHYISKEASPRGQAAKTEQAYKKAVRECQKVIYAYSQAHGGLAGFTAHNEPGKYGGINVNGSERTGSCEPFVLRTHYSENERFTFCKTRRYAYDTVVVACLIVLAHRMPGMVRVESDGWAHEWADGLTLAQNVLGIKGLAIPSTIKRKIKEA